MMTDANAHTEGSGQSVNVVLSGHGNIVIFVVALIIVAIVSIPFSVWAKFEAAQATRALEEQKTEARLVAYWMERAEVACEKQGVRLPPVPKS